MFFTYPLNGNKILLIPDTEVHKYDNYHKTTFFDSDSWAISGLED